ncbi:MAG: hypothetical protein QOH22_1610 [Gemmatimonadaceae bacterium]|nr:hypothetical protein [Gemmatimonadaceae bacterium]
MPTRPLSRCWASLTRGVSDTVQSNTTASEMAGECGNRTHPTLRSKVTVILKITEATRPHPPPSASLNLDRRVSPVDDLANQHCSGHA